jgi:hypothetical protein
MSNQSISQPAARTYPVVDLVAAAYEGRIRIPEFQRPLRWQWEDVRRLFDSIVKGYPIGNLLLWKRIAPEGVIRLGSLRIQSRAFDEGWWVVDGQQRLTSLANALSEEGAKDERFALAYDLGSPKGGFVRPSRDDDGFIVPLPVLFDLQRLIRWFNKEHPEAGEKLDEASRITRAIREYQVPTYLVNQDDEAVLRDIFDRMNNYGKRLRLAEVFSALHPGKNVSEVPVSEFQRIAEFIDVDQGFGRVDDDTVLRAMLARRGGNVSRDIRVEFSSSTRESRDFGAETPEQAYREGELALARAVAFLQEDAGIPHFALLPYRYLLVVLTRFFAHFPEPEPRNRVLLRRWFWRAALIGPGPFASSWTNAMRVLATRIRASDENGSVRRLLESQIDLVLSKPSLTGFKTNTAASRIVLSALWALKPRSLLTGQLHDRQQLTEAIQTDSTLAGVARRILNREPEDQALWAANRILVLDDELPGTVADLLIEPPLWRQAGEPEFLGSHALDDELIQMLARDDKGGFLNHRQRLIDGAVKNFIERMTESHLEDTPPLDSFDLDDLKEERDDVPA